MDDGELDQDLILSLRRFARYDASVIDLIDAIYKHFGAGNASVFTVIVYFMEAFDLKLPDVQPIEGATYFGNELYTDEQIEAIFQPLIQDAIKKQEG